MSELIALRISVFSTLFYSFRCILSVSIDLSCIFRIKIKKNHEQDRIGIKNENGITKKKSKKETVCAALGLIPLRLWHFVIEEPHVKRRVHEPVIIWFSLFFLDSILFSNMHQIAIVTCTLTQ